MLRFPNGKCYVGQTRRKRLSDRIRAHKNRCNDRDKKCHALYAAIRLYGWNAVEVIVLHRSVPNDTLDSLEQLEIQNRATLSPGGYNLTPGGDVNPMIAGVSAREKLSVTCSTPEHKLATSKRIKELHADPTWRGCWLEAHKEAHQRPETRAKIVSNNKIAWSKPGEKARRGEAIRTALNTSEQLALRVERHAKMKATKERQREEMLSKLPPEERAKKEKYLARKRAARQKRVPGSQ